MSCCTSLLGVKISLNLNLDGFLCQEYYSLALSWHQPNRQQDDRDDVGEKHLETGVGVITIISRPVGNNILKYPLFLLLELFSLF